jgi:type III secretion system YscQ/HrcQ family protein
MNLLSGFSSDPLGLPTVDPALVVNLNAISRLRLLEIGSDARSMLCGTMLSDSWAERPALDLAVMLGETQGWLRLDASFITNAVARFGDPEPLLADEPLMILILRTAFEAIQTALESRLGIPCTIIGLQAAPDEQSFVTLLMRDRAGEKSWSVGVSTGLLPDMRQLADKLPRIGLQGAIPVLARLEVGAERLALKTVSELETGDVIVLMSNSLSPRQPILKLGGTIVFRGSFVNTGFKIESAPAMVVDPSGPRTGQSGEDMDENVNLMEKLEVPVTFEIDRRLLRVSELSELAPGYIFELPSRPGGQVDIVVNGQTIGLGELIKVGDRLGVRTVRLFGHGA